MIAILKLETLKRVDLFSQFSESALRLLTNDCNDIIRHKPNCQPKSVKDRFTVSHEYVFLFSNLKNIFLIKGAIKELLTDGNGLDPFFGAGTAGVVAEEFGRQCILPISLKYFRCSAAK